MLYWSLQAITLCWPAEQWCTSHHKTRSFDRTTCLTEGLFQTVLLPAVLAAGGGTPWVQKREILGLQNPAPGIGRCVSDVLLVMAWKRLQAEVRRNFSLFRKNLAFCCPYYPITPHQPVPLSPVIPLYFQWRSRKPQNGSDHNILFPREFKHS